MNAIFFLTGLACGLLAGGALMFEVAKAMVDKVRTREERKHQDLIRQMDDAAGTWMDIVNEIQRQVQLGKMQGKSIKDQLMVIKAAISDANKAAEEDEEVISLE